MNKECDCEGGRGLLCIDLAWKILQLRIYYHNEWGDASSRRDDLIDDQEMMSFDYLLFNLPPFLPPPPLNTQLKNMKYRPQIATNKK